jgi:hypothetical protein
VAPVSAEAWMVSSLLSTRFFGAASVIADPLKPLAPRASSSFAGSRWRRRMGGMEERWRASRSRLRRAWMKVGPPAQRGTESIGCGRGRQGRPLSDGTEATAEKGL